MDFIFAPFAFILRHLIQILDNYGFALIVFASLIAVFRLPFDFKGRRGNLKQALIQPKVKEIQDKFAGDQQKIQQEIHKLWQKEGVKPLGGCIWMVFPAAIMLILINIVRAPLTHLMNMSSEQVVALRDAMYQLGLSVPEGDITGFDQVRIAGYLQDYYPQLQAMIPDVFRTAEIFPLNMQFLGMNLGVVPQWRIWEFFGHDDFLMYLGLFFLPLFSVVMMFLSQKIMMATNYMQQSGSPQQQQMMKMMMMTFPLVSLFIGFTFPAAMSVYFISSSFFFTFASIFINRKVKKIFEQMKAEMEERDRQREAELEEKRQETARLRALNATRENKATSKKKKQIQEREKERQRQAAQRAALGIEDEDEDREEENPAREGHRRFARGRAYNPERFEGIEEESEEDLDQEEEEYPEEDLPEAIEETSAADSEEAGEEEEIDSGGDEDEEDSDEDAWDADDDWDEEDER